MPSPCLMLLTGGRSPSRRAWRSSARPSTAHGGTGSRYQWAWLLSAPPPDNLGGLWASSSSSSLAYRPAAAVAACLGLASHSATGLWRLLLGCWSGCAHCAVGPAAQCAPAGCSSGSSEPAAMAAAPVAGCAVASWLSAFRVVVVLLGLGSCGRCWGVGVCWCWGRGCCGHASAACCTVQYSYHASVGESTVDGLGGWCFRDPPGCCRLGLLHGALSH
jgi:hypothetical protein